MFSGVVHVIHIQPDGWPGQYIQMCLGSRHVANFAEVVHCGMGDSRFVSLLHVVGVPTEIEDKQLMK